MATYFIGDVHGCYDELMLLLEKVQFNRHQDTLVFVGDLINRGPKSVEVLRFIRDLGDAAQVVLGNHDVSFLAYAVGAYHGRGSDFPEMMQADDVWQLLDWLRYQPLLFEDERLNVVVVHAGISPLWTLDEARKHARRVEKKLQKKKYKKYLKKAYRGTDGLVWSSELSRYEKFCYRINTLTRLRYCDDDGRHDYRDKCPLGEQSQGLSAWFDVRKQMQDDGGTKIIFGHWAALGYREEAHAICIDSGCAWGESLTAITIDGDTITTYSVPSLKKEENFNKII